MRLESLTRIIQLLRESGPRNPDITGITCDSRRVRPGYLFVALRGRHYDGADYIDAALKRGASAVVSESESGMRKGVSHVYVEDARRVLSEISCAYYGHPSSRLQMIGVTGTNGKTTTVFMARGILAMDGRKPGLIGTVHYEIGERRIPAERTTPEAPELQAMLDQMLESGCHSAVMEVSSHALDQKRVWGIDFDVGVFTNLTQDHLDYHGTLEKYFAAKARLFRGLGQMGKRAVAAINIDDPWGMKLAGINGFSVQQVTFGMHPAADVRAEDVKMDATGSSFTLKTPWGEAGVQLRLLGRFNISNALAAATSCGALGIAPELMAEALGRIEAIPGRLELVSEPGCPQVFVDYAHTPDALHNVLTTVREFAPRRILLVFGCGGDRDRAKRPRMGSEAARLADYSIITNDNPRSEDPPTIAAEILEGFGGHTNVETVLDREEAIARALALVEDDDIVLVAGKGHESYQQFDNTVVEFDDREVVRNLLS